MSRNFNIIFIHIDIFNKYFDKCWATYRHLTSLNCIYFMFNTILKSMSSNLKIVT